MLQFSCCDCAPSVVDGNTVQLCSRAEVKGAVLVCQEANYLHFHKLLLQTVHYRGISVGLTGTRQAALERQNLSCTYPAHHEPQNILLNTVIDYFWGLTGGTVGHILQSLSQTYLKKENSKVRMQFASHAC